MQRFCLTIFVVLVVLVAHGTAHAARLQSIAFGQTACLSANDDSDSAELDADLDSSKDPRDTSPDLNACTIVSLRALLSESEAAPECAAPNDSTAVGFSHDVIGGACAIGKAAEHRHVVVRAPGKTARLAGGVATTSRAYSNIRDDSALHAISNLHAPPLAAAANFADDFAPLGAAFGSRLDRPPRDN